MEYKLNIAEIILKELERSSSNNHKKIKSFLHFNNKLCNDVLYTDSRYKESVIILTHIFRNLTNDFCKQITDCVNNEGVDKKDNN